MKVFNRTMLFISLVFVTFSCSTAYISSEGAYLEKYYDPDTLLVLTQTPDPDIWIIDVRGEAAYNRRHIPTARNFFSGEILDRLDELPKDIGLILYCETGGRAQMVINNLEDEGYTKMLNWGGNSRWPYEYDSNE
ncbi:MAG: rhodanese-like domain-containing protein [Candidatus Neomarinimicrobiota bacterium]|jgi:rhodanese-related sulfurtransferase